MQVDPDFRYPETEGVISIPLYIILSVFTCGLWGLVWQYKQFQILNAWEGEEEHNFWMWLLLSIITFGLYGVYYEYKLSKSINAIQEAHGMKVNSDLPLICLLLTLFGLNVFGITSAIQQNDINKFYN